MRVVSAAAILNMVTRKFLFVKLTLIDGHVKLATSRRRLFQSGDFSRKVTAIAKVLNGSMSSRDATRRPMWLDLTEEGR